MFKTFQLDSLNVKRRKRNFSVFMEVLKVPGEARLEILNVVSRGKIETERVLVSRSLRDKQVPVNSISTQFASEGVKSILFEN